MIDARKWIWIPLITFALGVGIGAGFKGCEWKPVGPDVPVVVDPPAPIPDEGFHVLLVYEAMDQIELPAGVQEIIKSNADGSVRHYLDGLRDAGKVEYRFLDDDQPDLSKDSPAVQAMYKLPRQSIPWLIVSNGKTGYQGPCPEQPAECLALIQKYEVK